MKKPKTYRVQSFIGLELKGLSEGAMRRVELSPEIVAALAETYRLELAKLDIFAYPRVMRAEEVRAAYLDGPINHIPMNEQVLVTGARPWEPGRPLRQFVRGFLRDHLGTSKIVAHLLADLFMKRWDTAKTDGTARRYAEEMDDKHTLAATFDREAAEATDKMLGMTDRAKADMVFPDRPFFDPSSRLFSAGR